MECSYELSCEQNAILLRGELFSLFNLCGLFLSILFDNIASPLKLFKIKRQLLGIRLYFVQDV